ncbi:MAG: long-chain-fatty-acid--CoA ligase [Burkholderiales bacterium]|nr:long-chain-fatty-acid--CoA ligase [Burkholderiales bacterium]
MPLTLALNKAVREQPGRLAVICGTRRTTYAEFGDRVARLAGALRTLGVARGDRIAILAPNTDRFLEALYAAWWIGAIATPLNCRWSADELAYALQDSGARLLLADDPFAGLVPVLRARAPALEQVAWMGDDARRPAQSLAWEPWLTGAAPVADVRAAGDDAAVLFYTGGTTGRAKGVLLSHAGLFATTLASIVIGGRAPGAVCLHALPMFHVGGLAVVLQAMAGQCTQVMLAAFDPAVFFGLIASERVSEAALVPTMIRRVVDHPGVAQADLSSLERLYYGASPIDGTLLEQTIACLPGVALTQFYGMTETAGIAVALPDWCHGADSRALGRHLAAGLPTPCMEVRVVRPDGADAAPGEVGEVWLRGPGVMLGYWQLPVQTAEVLHDGWMRTGDGGRLDAEGLLHIVDRLKDMIVTGGENVYSTEVENAVLSLPGVAQCAVIGVPDAQWGERVHAVVVAHPGAAVDAAAVVAHCKSLIAGYKCPRSVEFRDQLPVSGAGKLLKYQLREAHWADRERRAA